MPQIVYKAKDKFEKIWRRILLLWLQFYTPCRVFLRLSRQQHFLKSLRKMICGKLQFVCEQLKNHYSKHNDVPSHVLRMRYIRDFERDTIIFYNCYMMFYFYVKLQHSPKNYAFGYAVKDDYTGDDYSHKESRDGYTTSGEYRVCSHLLFTIQRCISNN